MTTNTASCRCGQLRVSVTGQPVRCSICHCLACQKRTGSAFAAQARFNRDQVRTEGSSREWERKADSGQMVIYSFCPDCGSTVHFRGGNFPELVAIPLGAFDDPYFVRPSFSVWEKRRHAWVQLVGEFKHSL